MVYKVNIDKESVINIYKQIVSFRDSIGVSKSDFIEYFSKLELEISGRLKKYDVEISNLEDSMNFRFKKSDYLEDQNRLGIDRNVEIQNEELKLITQQINNLEYKKSDLKNKLKKLNEIERNIISILSLTIMNNTDSVLSFIKRLEEIIEDYNSVNFESNKLESSNNVSNQIGASAKKDKTSELIEIDNIIDNCKSELIENGVPDGQWIKDSLNNYKESLIFRESKGLDYSDKETLKKEFDEFLEEYREDLSQKGYCINWKKFNQTTNKDSIIRLTNPKFVKNTVWGFNCQRCVPTYEMRSRGYDVTSYPAKMGYDHISYYPFEVWKNPQVLNTCDSGMIDIENYMREWGDGSRAQVVVKWKNAPAGHTFIAEQRNGKTYFIDPQNNNNDVSNYFNLNEFGFTLLCRIDNLVPSDLIATCCEEIQ